MNGSVWQCGGCLALTAGAATCRVCGRERAAVSPVLTPLPRILLTLSHREDPNVRARATSGQSRSLFAPALLLAAAVLLAVGVEPAHSEIAHARVAASTVEQRNSTRRIELRRATRDLQVLAAELRPALEPAGSALSTSWSERLASVSRRHALGASAERSLSADDEVELRVALLELASLHHRYVVGALADDVLPRLDATERHLARVTEDLSHAP